MKDKKSKRIILNFTLSFCILIFAFCIFSKAKAAELNLTSPIQEFGINQQFQVDLMLDTQGEIINAIEGKIVFPKDLLEIKEIRDGDSIISFWVERPIIPLKNTNNSTNRHEIRFSGIIPTGFEGVLSPYYEGYGPGKIFSLIFISKSEGEGTVALENEKVLLHDGLGTPAEVSIFNFQFSIKEDIEITPIERVPDTTSPEPFTPEIAKEPSIFDGKWFLVFATQDKTSGIDYYEAKEERRMKIWNLEFGIWPAKWEVAESPYVLKDQKLKSWIYVKAVDKAGNERMVVVEPRYSLKWYENYLGWVIILVAFVVIYFTVRRKSKIREQISK